MLLATRLGKEIGNKKLEMLISRWPYSSKFNYFYTVSVYLNTNSLYWGILFDLYIRINRGTILLSKTVYCVVEKKTTNVTIYSPCRPWYDMLSQILSYILFRLCFGFISFQKRYICGDISNCIHTENLALLGELWLTHSKWWFFPKNYLLINEKKVHILKDKRLTVNIFKNVIQ